MKIRDLGQERTGPAVGAVDRIGVVVGDGARAAHANLKAVLHCS